MIYAVHSSTAVRRTATTLLISSPLVPLVLEALHTLPQSYAFREGHMIITSQMCALPEAATVALLTVPGSLLLLVAGWGIRRVKKALTEVEEKLAVQAWQLRQLVPEHARHRVTI